MQELGVQYQGQEDPLEEMATDSSTLAWKVPWMEEHGGLQLMGSQNSWTDLATKQQQQVADQLFGEFKAIALVLQIYKYQKGKYNLQWPESEPN